MKFEIVGYNIDNLVKTLHRKKVKILDFEIKDKNKATFCVLDKDEKKVKRYIKNFKTRTTLSKLKQIPKFFLANIGVVIGVFIGCIVSVFLSAYTWQIQVFGNENLSKKDIIEVLKENNVQTGKINLQTNEQIEEILLNKYDRIAQVSVIKQGTAIVINISEKLVYNETEFKPLVANYSGIVTSVNVVTGIPNVKVGDYVNKGDVLVLPFNINSNGEKVSVKPLAEISAQMFIVAKTELNKTEQVLTRTGNSSYEYRYKFFNFNLFSGKNKNSFANFETEVYNENVSDLLPFSRDVYKFYELKLETITHDFENEKEKLIEKSQNQARLNMPSGELINEETTTSIVGDKLYACTTLTILGTIND